MNRYVDLHVHTNYSDGSFSPREVVEHAHRGGFTAIGITDHDEVGGVSEAIWIGHAHGVEIVPAVEITSRLDSKEVHLLGYLIDHNHRELREELKNFRYDRYRRMEGMIGKLRNLGVQISLEAVRRVAGRGSLGRLHLARALYDRGLVDSVQRAFDLYIGAGKPAYVERPRLEVSDAVRLIASAGGIPVLAHPKLANVDNEIPELVHLGVRGIEAFYSKHTPDDTQKYLAMAEKYGLLVTGGSDCHGAIKDYMLLGSVKLPYRYLAALREFSSNPN